MVFLENQLRGVYHAMKKMDFIERQLFWVYSRFKKMVFQEHYDLRGPWYEKNSVPGTLTRWSRSHHEKNSVPGTPSI